MRFLRFNSDSAPTHRGPGGCVGNFPPSPGLAHPKPEVREEVNYSVFLCTDPQCSQGGRDLVTPPASWPWACERLLRKSLQVQ